MKRHVLFIQGAGKGAYTEDKKLAENLRDLLGTSYDVHFPKMKNENDAPYKTWVEQIKKELAALTGDVILVGHSVGGSILIKFLTEKNVQHVAGIFLIAAPFWGGVEGWTYEGYEKLVLPDEAVSKLKQDMPVFLYQSKDDETVPFRHLTLYARRFPDATVCMLDGRGHQLNNDLTEVAKDIRELQAA